MSATSDPRKADQRLLVLGQLGQAGPPAAVAQRIQRGALARLRQRERKPRGRLAWLAPAAAAAGLACLVAVLAAPLGQQADQQTRPDKTVASRRQVATTPATAPATSWRSTATPQVVRLGAHRLDLAPATALRQLQSGRRQLLRLDRGRATFSVAPLGDGGTFRVRTAHLGVEVIGTRFTVEVDGPCTEVIVSEGVVRVASEGLAPERLGAGERRTRCVLPGPEQLSAAEGLVKRALALVRQRRAPRRALALLEQYLAQHPRGALAEEALYHAAELEAELGHPRRARALARRFARRFGGERARRLRRQLEKKSATR